jgi:hypothetical protein
MNALFAAHQFNGVGMGSRGAKVEVLTGFLHGFQTTTADVILSLAMHIFNAKCYV